MMNLCEAIKSSKNSVKHRIKRACWTNFWLEVPTWWICIPKTAEYDRDSGDVKIRRYIPILEDYTSDDWIILD